MPHPSPLTIRLQKSDGVRGKSTNEGKKWETVDEGRRRKRLLRVWTDGEEAMWSLVKNVYIIDSVCEIMFT